MLGVVHVVLRADGEAEEGEQRDAVRVVVRGDFLEEEGADQVAADGEGDGDGDEGPYRCLRRRAWQVSTHVLGGRRSNQTFIWVFGRAEGAVFG